ncbi:hypothetical protein EV426DRAFT_588234, partial [Tirmania nivea]
MSRTFRRQTSIVGSIRACWHIADRARVFSRTRYLTIMFRETKVEIAYRALPSLHIFSLVLLYPAATHKRPSPSDSHSYSLLRSTRQISTVGIAPINVSIFRILFC